jgi:hypothetical protein
VLNFRVIAGNAIKRQISSSNLSQFVFYTTAKIIGLALENIKRPRVKQQLKIDPTSTLPLIL